MRSKIFGISLFFLVLVLMLMGPSIDVVSAMNPETMVRNAYQDISERDWSEPFTVTDATNAKVILAYKNQVLGEVSLAKTFLEGQLAPEFILKYSSLNFVSKYEFTKKALGGDPEPEHIFDQIKVKTNNLFPEASLEGTVKVDPKAVDAESYH